MNAIAKDGIKGSIMFQIDAVTDPDQIIIVKASGGWTVFGVEHLYLLLNREVAKRRATGDVVRVLYDVREITSIGFAVTLSTIWHFRRTYFPTDRIAILTADAQQKQALRNDMRKTGAAVFSSQLPAEMWLLSDLEIPHSQN